MATKCSLPNCDRPSQSICLGCRLAFCPEHMVEHNLSIHLQLNPLIDQTNDINNRLRTLDTDRLISYTCAELENWRIQSHQLVDDYVNEKIRELTEFLRGKVQRCEADLEKVQTKIIDFMREQATTHEQVAFLTSDLQSLEKDLHRLEDSDFQLRINPLNVDPQQITFGQVFHLSKLPVPYQTLARSSKDSPCLATDENLLLIHRDGSLVLVDDQMKILDQVNWKHGQIYDMSFCSSLTSFVVLTQHEVFLVDPRIMKITHLRVIPWQEWFACTCSKTYLYLITSTYSTSLIQYSLVPKIEFVKRWESSSLCSKDESIDGIVYKNKTLAMMISNESTKAIRLELRLSKTLERLWVLPLYLVYNPEQAYRFASFNGDEWLVADYHNARLLHISREGTVISTSNYHPTPLCLCTFSRSILAVSTKKGFFFHKI